MQLTNLLLAFSLSVSVVSAFIHPRQSNGTSISVSPNNSTLSTANSTTIIINDNQTSSNPLDIQCASFQELSALSLLSTNATLLQVVAQRNNLTAAQTAALQASSQNATMQLATIQASNSTLAATCTNSVQVSRACAQLQGLTTLDALASDPAKLSALQQQQNLSQAQVSELQAAAVNSKPLLQSLQSNQTLVDECSKFEAALGMGQGFADAAAAAAAGVSGAANGTNSGNGNANAGNGTIGGAAGATGTIGGVAEATGTGTPVASTTGTVPANGAGALEFEYGLMGTAFFVTVGMVVFG